MTFAIEFRDEDREGKRSEQESSRQQHDYYIAEGRFNATGTVYGDVIVIVDGRCLLCTSITRGKEGGLDS